MTVGAVDGAARAKSVKRESAGRRGEFMKASSWWRRGQNA